MIKKNIKKLALVGSMTAILSGCGSTAMVSSDYSSLVRLGEYKNIETGIDKPEVTEEDVKKVVDETIELAGGCFKQDDNTTLIEGYKAVVEEVPADGDLGYNQNVYLLGSEECPEEYKEALLGKKVGESVEVNGNIATVKSIYVPDEITDEFVESLQIEGVTTVEELKEDIRKYLSGKNEFEYNEKVKENASKLVFDGCEVKEVPENLVKEYEDSINSKVEALIEQYKNDSEEEITKADILSEQIAEDEFVGTVDEYIAWYAKKNAEEYMIYNAIAQKEGIEVSDEEVFSQMATDWASMTDKYETLADYVDAVGKDQYEKAILSSKVEEFIGNSTKEGLIAMNNEDADTSEEKEEASSENSSDSEGEKVASAR